MLNNAEEHVRQFYSTAGWEESDSGITEDARLFEDLRECARDYVSKCRLRLLRHIPPTGDKILDMASGPIQYPEYLEFSKGFNKRYCVDLSAQALQSAEKKLGEHGVYMHGSFFDLDLAPDTFDCVISLHTIYHMDRDMQEQAVRKLIRVCKPGAPVVIVYFNPEGLMRKIKKALRKPRMTDDHFNIDTGLYFFAHPLAWWKRFSNEADIRIYPWRSMESNDQKRMVPGNALGRAIFSLLYAAETSFPQLFVRYGTYPIVVLTKR
jgi:ubiquinone/menaquinone biosynthesis C-methylase UbiE